MPKQIVTNSKGEEVKLNAREKAIAEMNQRKFDSELRNALGFEIDITTLTAIQKSVTEQKFFTVNVADYIPVVVGEGAFATELLKYREFSTGGSFETGNLNTGSSNSRLAATDTNIDAIKQPIMNWAKEINWSLFDFEQASRAGNWDLVTAKERSRKKNWDLGIQEIAFLGLEHNAEFNGLLTLPDVNANTALITKFIKEMTAGEYDTFVQGIINAYRSNANYTQYPTHFIIPEEDYTGLGAPVSETFPNVTKLEYLLKVFRMITRNEAFEILPLAYANQSQNADFTGLNKNRYVLLNNDYDTISMDIPVDYTNTIQNTINGFQWQNVGYGQYTGVRAYRPLEVLYFDWSV